MQKVREKEKEKNQYIRVNQLMFSKHSARCLMYLISFNPFMNSTRMFGHNTVGYPVVRTLSGLKQQYFRSR